MASLTLEQLRSFAQQLEGQTLMTLSHKKRFTVRATLDGFEFTPLSTGQPRRHEQVYAQRVIERFNETDSFKPKDYQELTFNASYILTLIREYITRREK